MTLSLALQRRLRRGGGAAAPNLLKNPGFDDASEWIVGAPWEITGGVATFSGGTSGTYFLYQINVLDLNTGYRVGVTASGVAGVVRLQLGNLGPVFNLVDGSNEFIGTTAASGNGNFLFTAGAGATAVLDNAYCMRA